VDSERLPDAQAVKHFAAHFVLFVLVGTSILCVRMDLRTVGAQSFFWDAPPLADGVTNHRVYSGPASRNYDTVRDAGTNTSVAIPSNAPAFYAVTAVDYLGQESGYSAEWLYIPAPPGSRAKLRIMERDGLAGPWREFAAIPLTGSEAVKFFQLRITP
jgi:hypothetical protein